MVGAHALTAECRRGDPRARARHLRGEEAVRPGGLVHVYPTLSIGIGQLAGDASYERAGQAELPGPLEGLGLRHRELHQRELLGQAQVLRGIEHRVLGARRHQLARLGVGHRVGAGLQALLRRRGWRARRDSSPRCSRSHAGRTLSASMNECMTKVTARGGSRSTARSAAGARREAPRPAGERPQCARVARQAARDARAASTGGRRRRSPCRRRRSRSPRSTAASRGSSSSSSGT